VTTKLCEKTGSTSEIEAGCTTSSSRSSSSTSSTSSSSGNRQNSVYDDEEDEVFEIENEKENNEKRSRTSNSSNLQEGMECSAADFRESTPFTSIRTFEVSIRHLFYCKPFSLPVLLYDISINFILNP
jgi:hypothetical protein